MALRPVDRLVDRATAGVTTAGPDFRLCRCGHTLAAHEHYRPGTDCALCACGCDSFRPAGNRVLGVGSRVVSGVLGSVSAVAAASVARVSRTLHR